MIKVEDYPQLKLIVWNRAADAELDDAEAFSLYERNWRHIVPDDLEPHERALIERLIEEIGHGVLNV